MCIRDSPKAVYEAVINEVEETRKNGLSKEDFERIKKVVWGEYIRSQNDVEAVSYTHLDVYKRQVLGVTENG